jgi:hypothetical protein
MIMLATEPAAPMLAFKTPDILLGQHSPSNYFRTLAFTGRPGTFSPLASEIRDLAFTHNDRLYMLGGGRRHEHTMRESVEYGITRRSNVQQQNSRR